MRKRYGFVHAHEESIFFCVFLKPLFRFKLIYDMHSSLPQQLYCKIASVQLPPRTSGTNTPLKIYEQLASGIPLVATAIYSHTQVIDKTVAILVQPDSASMASGIIEALQNPAKSRQIAASARTLYEEKYSRMVY